jgi:Fe-S-cluster-containing hydrogenase component 2
MDPHGLPVIDAERCTACGDCVEICPKALFSIQPVSHRLWIACKSQADGERAEADCAVACTACERCVFDAPEGLIRIENNLAVINYQKNAMATQVAIERCPTGAIVWLADAGRVQKGSKAKKLIRQTALPVG